MNFTRREFLASLPAPFVLKHLARTGQFRLAICNEIFQGWNFSDTCKGARTTGYTGLEIAPFTLSDYPASIPASQRAEIRNVMRSEGLEFVGLHWLLSTPKGLHVTTPDPEVRQRSWGYLRQLVELCSDLGDGGIMVFGSGRQRGTTAGSRVKDAVERLKEGLAGLASAAQTHGVTILLEPLAPHLCDVVNTLGEAVAIVKEIGSPAVQTLFDVHNAAAETLPHDQVIKKYYRYIRHVQINEMDGKHPGTGSYDFRRLLKAFKELSYTQWISLEVFDFSPGGETIARDSSRFIRQIEAELNIP